MGILISLRGQGPWTGVSSQVVNDRGERRQSKIINGYVSMDGGEIRQRPGWHTLLDLTPENNSNGYHRRIVDMRLPVYDWVTGNTLYQANATKTETTLVSWAQLKHLHCMEQVRNRLILVGESGFRRNPIYSSSRQELTVVSISTAANMWQIVMSGTVGAPTTLDASGAGLNGLIQGDVVYLNIDIDDPTLAPYASQLKNRFSVVKVVVGNEIRIQSDTSLPTVIGYVPTRAKEIYKTRANASGVYPVSPYEPNKYNAIDDPDALTIYTIVDAPDLDNPTASKAQPAWVANRQRDGGDDLLSSGANPSYRDGVKSIIGYYSPGLLGFASEDLITRSISRRRQKSLPYRVNPDVAGNRLVLAAPGYACLFQCPLIIPTHAESYPSPSDWTETSGQGVVHWFNDLHDKPRSLGLPKPILIDSNYPSPNEGSPTIFGTYAWSPPYNHAIYPIDIVASPGTPYSFPQGKYRFCITYYDDYTGEESLASEEVTIIVPTKKTYAPYSGYSIALKYLHPGYYFPECLGMSINVYMATNNQEPCAFYKRFPLQNSSYATTTPQASAKYGFEVTSVFTPENPRAARFGNLRIPVPINTTPDNLSSTRDTTRLAPQSLQMPRGAECFRYIRGVALSGGSLGSHGKSGELLYSTASAIYRPTATPTFENKENVLSIRVSATPSVELSTPSIPYDGGFGIASNYFPPAYTGVGIYSETLYPAPRQLAFVNKILNSTASNFVGQTSSPAFDYNQANVQRLELDENIFDKDNATQDGYGSPYRVIRTNKPIYMLMPKGQLLVGEPGRPEVAIGSAIQIIDPTKDADITAIGQYAGGAIVCSKRETYTLNWNRAPQGQTPILVTNEHGCIAANSMVEFDGGLAWIGERGPVALTGSGFEWIGRDIARDFLGSNRKYVRDSNGMMRHVWSCHDQERCLVYWGMVTSDATHTLEYQGVTATYANHNDRGKSRFACNEILVWSYRTNAFSVWKQPQGLEIYWMRQLTDKNGDMRVCFLAADGRIYAMDEEWQDTNRKPLSLVPVSSGVGTQLVTSTTFAQDGSAGAAIARGTGEYCIRPGMTVVQVNSDGEVVDDTTIVSATAATSTIVLAKSMSWSGTDRFEVGHRPAMTIETKFVGDAPDNMDVSNIQVRYSLQGKNAEKAYAKVSASNVDLRMDPTTINYTQEQEWYPLGEATADPHGNRRSFTEGRATGPEISFQCQFRGTAHVRVSDILLEVS